MAIAIERITADTSDADRQIDNFLRRAGQAAQQVTRIMRKSFESVQLLTVITGRAVNASFNMMIEAAFVAAETVFALATAETLTLYGAAKAAVSFAVSANLFIMANNLKFRQSEAAQQIIAMTTLANTWL